MLDTLTPNTAPVAIHPCVYIRSATRDLVKNERINTQRNPDAKTFSCCDSRVSLRSPKCHSTGKNHADEKPAGNEHQ